ncbi:MAG: glycosyltransferase family 4 protein [Acidimicrobiales bacterium]
MPGDAPIAIRAVVVMPLAFLRGGAELALRNLVCFGNGHGISWLVVFLEHGPMVDDLASQGVATVVVPAGRFRQLARTAATVLGITRLIRRHRADVVVSWMSKGQVYGGPAAALARVPATWYQVGTPSPGSRLERLATLLPARTILTCSGSGAVAQDGLVPRRPVRVVYPGIALDRFDPHSLPPPQEARRLLGMPQDGPMIGTVGRLQRWKGMHLLIEAMPTILQAHPRTHCVVVGERHDLEPDYLRHLEDLVEALGLQEHVQLLVQRSSPMWVQAMDVAVHVSENEPFGIVVVEAMALAKPVVAGNTGGPTELITDGENGVLVPFGDSAAVARAVSRFLSDPDLAAQTGAAAHLRAQEFSVKSFVSSFSSAVEQIVRPVHG